MGMLKTPTSAGWTGFDILHFRSAMTLVGVLIVIALLAIAAGLVIPTLGDSNTMRLREAARMLAADIEYAQSDSIAHGDAPRAIVFDTNNRNRYWIAPRVANQPAKAPAMANAIADPVWRDPANAANYAPFVTVFGQNRAAATTGVTIQSVQNLVNDGGLQFLAFNVYGVPIDSAGLPRAASSSPARVTITGGASTMVIEVQAGTGEVTVR